MEHPFAPPSITSSRQWIIILGLCIVSGVILSQFDTSLTGSIARLFRRSDAPPVLGSCSGYDSKGLFAVTDSEGEPIFMQIGTGANTIDVWSAQYHGDVEEAVEQHLKGTTVECDAEGDFPPVPKIADIAKRLPPWIEVGTSSLTRNDTSAVLLEYLHSYECALAERFLYLTIEVKEEEEKRSDIIEEEMPDISELTMLLIGQMRQTLREIALSRPTLNRVLSYIGGLGLLDPLNQEVECLQHASIDIRNGVGLSAEVSACLPRVWEGKDPLRDLYDPPD